MKRATSKASLNIEKVGWPYASRLYLHWEDFLFISLWWLDLIVAEHENVSTGRVSMEIAKEEDVSTL